MKKISSRALAANIEEYRISVTIDPKYLVIKEVMSRYDGLQKVVHTFLEELCHPRRNWQFIVNEARTLSLGYFYDLKLHSKGDEALQLYIDIASEAISVAKEPMVRTDAFHNLYLLLQKIIKESGTELARLLPVVHYGFNRMHEMPDSTFPAIAKSYYQIKKLADLFSNTVPPHTDFTPLVSLLTRYFDYTLSYWLSERDPQVWFENELSEKMPRDLSHLFHHVSHSYIKKCQDHLHAILSNKDNENPLNVTRSLLELPGYGEIVESYRRLPDSVFQSIENERSRHHCKLILLFHSLNITGLSAIHEESLREINQTITWLIRHEDIGHIQDLIDQTFTILRRRIDSFPGTVMKSLLTMGMGIYKTDKSELVHYFNERLVQIGFQTPNFQGITDDWQIQSNQAHIQNIRTWMSLISLNPKWSKKLLSSLIIHLSLSGILIKDTDLFPRDITEFLNSDIQPVYNLMKQLMRVFPSYFNEIGAEGTLRDISTRIDEICNRKDRLVHFLRKQSHVESSNKIISLIESTLEFWKTKSREGLQPYLPPNIYAEIDVDGLYIDGVHDVLTFIFETRGLKKISDLLTLDEAYLEELQHALPAADSRDIERVTLAISFFRLLNQKYNLSHSEIGDYVTKVQSTIPLKLGEISHLMKEKDTYKKISGLLHCLEKLKEVILSREKFEIREDIYRKRHIAANIPSMYGSYHEVKFDALGLTFRLEFLVNTLFEELVEDFNLTFITHDTFYRIYEYLKIFHRSLSIDGIPSRDFKQQLDLLKRSLTVKLFTFSQYVDIFHGFTQIVRNIVNNYFDSIHKQNLLEIANMMPIENLLPKYRLDSENRDELFQKVAEIFLRDAIASSLGLQRLDLFLTRITNTLHDQAEKLPVDKHYLLLTYNPANVVTSLSHPAPRLLDVVHLGNKALNMIRMRELKLPVPPGFVITTEVFRCRDLIDSYKHANENFKEHLRSEMTRLEKQTGKKYGSPENALLVSVRSGSAITQPGMMDSYLNVGMNEEIAQGMIQKTKEEWFAWDSYRRFLQSYGMSFGINRDEFDAVIDAHKKKYDVSLKREFSPVQMREVAISYKNHIRSKGLEVEESPWEQLYIAITRVLNSWHSDKALSYRKIMGISDDWGTAVTVQAMVFGNLSQQSGSGVLFTHSPKFSTDILRPWGDYTVGNQGEDVVSGLVTTYPISLFQANMEHRSSENALERKFPEIYHALREYAKVLVYDNQWSPQDIEFTFEGPQKDGLSILQTRNMDMRERKIYPTFQSSAEISENLIGHGIGVSGGALSGRVVFGLDDISRWKQEDPPTPLILVRGDTVPDDIREISAADGLLTARGGATSHAAIVANRLEKTCVVGCRDLVCMEKQKKFTLNGRTVHAGEFISIDGAMGSIYLGKMKVHERGAY